VQGFDINASNCEAGAQGSRMQGKQAMTAELFGAASPVLGGAPKYLKLKKPQ
jgi:hypothetical protein